MPSLSNKKKIAGLLVETTLLVAVWENPFIFQGCIKITELNKNNQVLYFFRCQSHHKEQQDIVNDDFSADNYQFTHLYHELGFIQLSSIDPTKKYALHMMKYALHTTLREMITSRKLHFTSIDDIAMQAMITRIKPILNKQVTLAEDDHIGFAVTMDFCPKEEMGYLAALALLNTLGDQDQSH